MVLDEGRSAEDVEASARELRAKLLEGDADAVVTAGEEAGELPRMCDVVSRNYDREVEHLTKNVATMTTRMMSPTTSRMIWSADTLPRYRSRPPAFTGRFVVRQVITTSTT